MRYFLGNGKCTQETHNNNEKGNYTIRKGKK